MAIIYNGTPVSSLKYNEENVSVIWVCDTSTTCCTKVFPEMTLGYSYCEFTLPTISLQDTCIWSYPREGDYTIDGNGTDSTVCISGYAGLASSISSLISCVTCNDASPVCQGSVGEYCYCISTESRWSSVTATINTVNCLNDTVCNCSYSFNVEYDPKYLRIPQNSLRVAENIYYATGELTWYSETSATLPTNTRYAVACITNTTSGITCRICCPITNSSGSVDFCFVF